MSHPSLQIKKAYSARVRRSNYIASLRLAGFQCGFHAIRTLSPR